MLSRFTEIGPRPLLGQLNTAVAILNAELTRREPTLVGWREDGSNLYVRFRAALSTPWVQVHVQSSVAGEGGVTTYDTTNYTSTTLVDCRADRLQDVTIGVVSGERYAVFLVPVQEDGAGTQTLFDGAGGVPDNKSMFAVMIP